MPAEFTKNFQVRWSELNAHGHLDVAGCLRYVIETAWGWGAAGGLSFADSAAQGMAWILRENELRLFRPVTAGENLNLTIWLWEWRRVRGTRCFEIYTDSGELVGNGAQQVVVLDSQTLRPRRFPPEYLAEFMGDAPRHVAHQEFPKFPPPPAAAFALERDVAWGDLDWLRHVNNTNYAVFAEDAVAAALASLGWAPARLFAEALVPLPGHFHIQYQTPAVWGDRLRISAWLTELTPAGGTWYVDMTRVGDGAAVCQCTLSWSAVDPAGKALSLPDELVAGLSRLLVTHPQPLPEGRGAFES